MENANGRLILFGAGRNGRMALEKYGRDRVAFFCDNNTEKVGGTLEGIPIISFDNMREMHEEGYVIMITPTFHAYQSEQLALAGINDYLIFRNEETRFPLKNGTIAEKEHQRDDEILNELTAASCRNDPLENISSLRETVKEAKRLHSEEKKILGYYGFHHESHYYGNIETLIEYAEIAKEDIPYFPIVSHADSMPVYTVDYMYKTAVVMSGIYYRNRIHRQAPWVPVFSVGPYIHYANGIYDAEKISDLKKKNGRTLLAFLPHSIEGYEKKYSYKTFIDEIRAAFGQKFEQIMLCVYWADADSEACSYAEGTGMKVVSAGFRWDAQFDCRLRTLLELADAVVFGDAGTFIPYAIHMEKPIGKIDGRVDEDLYVMQMSEMERKIGIDKEYLKYMDRFNDLFHEKLEMDSSYRKFMNPFAGFDQIRSKKYIRDIARISKDIWIQSDGDMLHYPEAVRQIYWSYEKNGDFCKMSILREAVGAYVD